MSGEMPVLLTVEEMARWPVGSRTVVERARRDSRLGAGRESVGERRTGREAVRVRVGMACEAGLQSFSMRSGRRAATREVTSCKRTH